MSVIASNPTKCFTPFEDVLYQQTPKRMWCRKPLQNWKSSQLNHEEWLRIRSTSMKGDITVGVFCCSGRGGRDAPNEGIFRAFDGNFGWG